MISMNWVKDYIDLTGEDLKELAVKVTQAGINVENVITNHIDHLVIGEVVECVEHPDSDHLHVCKVNVGDSIEQIVCGAANVREGIKVIDPNAFISITDSYEVINQDVKINEANEE